MFMYLIALILLAGAIIALLISHKIGPATRVVGIALFVASLFVGLLTAIQRLAVGEGALTDIGVVVGVVLLAAAGGVLVDRSNRRFHRTDMMTSQS